MILNVRSGGVWFIMSFSCIVVFVCVFDIERGLVVVVLVEKNLCWDDCWVYLYFELFCKIDCRCIIVDRRWIVMDGWV